MSMLDIATKLSFWGPVTLFALGIPGALINGILFIGIKTFRQSPSSYYVVGQSLFDIVALLILFLQIFPSLPLMSSGTSCRLMVFFTEVTVPCAMSFLCLAAFDRWACTSRSARIRQLSSKNIARCLFPMPFLFWSCVNAPYLIFVDYVPQLFSCWFTNDLFQQIATYFLTPFMVALLPLIILVIFGILTHRNIRLIKHMHIQQNQARNRLSQWEQQMTRMMIAQTCISIICILPQLVVFLYTVATLNTRAMRSYDQVVLEYLINQITTFIIGINFASSFYIFFLSSPRFRKSIKMYLKQLIQVRDNRIGIMDVSLTAQNGVTQHQDKHH
ncbi:unnamed protein product [Adineta steineri]|uniref:G-protein coupled receptors family 1 profile domain-containing protein n=1 Tax=Adineta steineri TaxID=433720 RepID=A0A815KGZ9_9BILA|nr:unnamed protein product [Adineta steineri]CAF1612435.1 unnamed protein product [Adineta steineri]